MDHDNPEKLTPAQADAMQAGMDKLIANNRDGGAKKGGKGDREDKQPGDGGNAGENRKSDVETGLMMTPRIGTRRRREFHIVYDATLPDTILSTV